MDQKEETSFSSLGSYGKAVLDMPNRLPERLFAVWTPTQELTEVRARSGAEMQKNLRWFDLVTMGVGGMVGAGIFVTTGSAARLYSGPSIIVAYVVAGISALLSAFCYTEFAVEMPVAGGAFSYLRITFGEFAAFFTGANLLMEYVLSNAAVARSFTSYFATVFGISAIDDVWRIECPGLSHKYNMLDFPAIAVILILTLFLCYSTKDSSIFNMIVTLSHLLFIIFIIVAGFVKGDAKNFTHPGNASNPAGFFPFGARGVFNGAAIVYFSYIGYDSVSTLAEEVKHPAKDIPIGVSGSVVIVSVLYCLMAASICMLLPYDMIDSGAPFSTAFNHVVGWKWASNVVGMGASLGIVTSLLVAMLGQARYLCVIGRARIIPEWFAQVNSRTGTPVHATIFLGICTSVIALFTNLEVLLDLISIGTLFVFYMVANALIFRRYVGIGSSNAGKTLWFLVSLTGCAIGFIAFWQLEPELWWGLAVFIGLAMVLTFIFWYKVPASHVPKEWGVPLMPWIPAASIFLNVFLLGSVDTKSYVRFGVWSAIAAAFYLLYSVHSTYDADKNRKSQFAKGVMDLELQPQSRAVDLKDLPSKLLDSGIKFVDSKDLDISYSV